MMTSCSPGWIKFVEEFYPDLIPHLSSCKSPQQMLGAVVKSFFAERERIDPGRIFSVAVMPCTAKKFEAGRPEMGRDGRPDIDAVLTTRELAELIRMHGIDLATLAPEAPDTPFGERTSAGKLFGASGGVMEAALRTAHFFLTGESGGLPRLQPLRGLDGVKEFKATIAGRELSVAAVSGLGNARKVLEQVRAGRKDLHFLEVMTCPGGASTAAASRVTRASTRSRRGCRRFTRSTATRRCGPRTRTRRSSGSTPSTWRSRSRTGATNCCTRGTKKREVVI